MTDTPQYQNRFFIGTRPLDPAQQMMPGLGETNGFAAWGPMLSNMQLWAGQMMQFNASLHHEWLSFIEKRLKHDAALTQQLSDCKGPDEIMRTYSEFMRTAFEDYQQEFTTIAKIGGTATGDALGTTQAAQDQAAPLETRHNRASPASQTARKRSGTSVGTEH